MQAYQAPSANVKIAASLVAIIVIAVLVLLATHLKSPAQTTSMGNGTTASGASTGSSSDTTSSSQLSSTAAGKSYTASSTYQVPHGSESITVNLKVDNGTVTDVAIQNSESDHDSARYQEDFASLYKQYVVGKKVSEVKVGALAGASDTAQGFNDAVSRIATQVN